MRSFLRAAGRGSSRVGVVGLRVVWGLRFHTHKPIGNDAPDEHESAYNEAVEQAEKNPEKFWGEAAKEIQWFKKYDKVLDRENAPFYTWFKGGELNACYNAVDYHVKSGRGDVPAIHFVNAYSGNDETISYSKLLYEVQACAAALQLRGVEKGDRVVLYMPMIPEALVAMLACSRIGAIHSVVFGGFAAPELAKRLDDVKAKVIITATGGLMPKKVQEYMPIVNEAIETAKHKPKIVIVKQREEVRLKGKLAEGRDHDWDKAMKDAAKRVGLREGGKEVVVPCVSVDSDHMHYVLYTSGTTGNPKGIVRDTGGHLVALKWCMKNVFNTPQDSVFWAASDIGWVVGHSFIVYGPLLNGSTTLLFDGKPVGTPDESTWWRVLEKYKVRTMFAAPTGFRAIKREDPKAKSLTSGKFDLSSLESVFLAGERCDPDTVVWLQNALSKATGKDHALVYDNYWQTETGWPMVAPCVGLLGGEENVKIKPGSASRTVPGYALVSLDEDEKETDHVDGHDAEPTQLGVRMPLPPGTFPTLFNAPKRYLEAYITKCGKFYKTGDAGKVDKDGFVFIMSRTDDVINVAGHRLATSAIEEIVASHPEVAECAVFGVDDKLKGQIPMTILIPKSGGKDGKEADEELRKAIVHLVRKEIGPVADMKHVMVAHKLPKTRSGKILRKELSKIAAGQDYKMPPTIEDESVLPYIEKLFKKYGIGKQDKNDKNDRDDDHDKNDNDKHAKKDKHGKKKN